MKFLSDVRLLLVGLWLGAAVFFIGVAQAAFTVLPERELAGSVVGRALSIVDYAGLGVATLLILTSFIASGRAKKFWLWLERFLVLVIGAACATQEFVIGFWMSSIRSQIGGPIDNAAADDPLRIRFDQLHQYSEWILMAAMIAALITFFMIANRVYTVIKADAKSDIYDFSKEFKI
ncbi:MAG TPA: DUF4149 domain-containing protein [Pyrinomonadaceae bacterium]|nr:DUF4149 domain-containing protein [Pyrinomonadaceae bacterium]